MDRKRARKLADRERAVGIDPDDEAARWLREHDPPSVAQPPKSLGKSKALHRFRQRQGRT